MVTINDHSRLFVNNTGRVILGACNQFYMLECAGLSDLSQSKPETEEVRCPSSTRYNSFDVVATFPLPVERGTTSLSHYLDDGKSSTLNRLWKASCTFDLQLHIGSCTLPNEFNHFNKSIVLYDVELTSYAVSEPTALSEANVSPVVETVELTYRKHEEVLDPTLIAFSNAQVALGPVVGAHSFASSLCEPCQGSSTQYFVQWRAFNDGGTPQVDWGELWVVYTPDNGATWNSVAVQPAEVLETVQILNGYSGVSNVPDRLWTVILGSLIRGEGFENDSVLAQQGITINDRLDIDPNYVALMTSPQVYDVADHAGVTWTVGSNGYFVRRDSVQGAPTSIDLSTTFDIYSVSTLEGQSWIVGGQSGFVAVGDASGLNKLLNPAINGVHVNSEVTHVEHIDVDTYVLSTIDGVNIRTCNGGRHWHAMSGIEGCVTSMSFYDKYIGYAVTATDGVGVRLWQTLDGGISWRHVGKNGRGITYPMNVHINWISVSRDDPNVFSAGGRMTTAVITASEMCNPNTLWNYGNDTGVVILSKWK